jgi:hypothetical protein
METLAGSVGFTLIIIAFDTAGLPVGHGMFDVKVQVIISLLAGV